jgi:hypothetical protein
MAELRSRATLTLHGQLEQWVARVKKLRTLAGSAAFGCVIVALAAAAPSAAPTAAPLSAHRELLPGKLVVRGDRLTIAYAVDTPEVTSPTGTLYLRNDSMRTLARVTLTSKRPGVLEAVVPGRLLRGKKLLYFAMLRDPRTGRSVTIPKAGARSPDFVFVLDEPVTVRLGAHRFGRPRAPGTVVARAKPSDVGWRVLKPGEEGTSFGPQTFVVMPDRSIWLVDGLNSRLLVWRPGEPGSIARTVPLPLYDPASDVALGPAGTFYVLRGLPPPNPRVVLDRVSTVGQVWQSELAGIISARDGDLAINTALRSGPDGRLYAVSGRPGSAGAERGWRPLATASGRPISVAQQRRGDLWPGQPLAGGLRLVGTVYSARAGAAPREARFAVVDRRGRVVRAWRVLSGTDLNFNFATPDLVGGDPVVVLDVTAGTGPSFKWEYVVLRLGPNGTRTRFTLSHALFGDNLLADVRIGPDGKLYQLSTSPATGVVVRRYSLEPAV